MRRTPLLLIAFVLAALAGCRDHELPTALVPEGAAFDHQSGACEVSNTDDDGEGSLRHAIATADCAEIIFNLSGAGPHTIALTTGQLPIDRDLTIAGPGSASLTVSGNNASRVFFIASGTVAISGLTLSGGSADDGGGILNRGTLTLTNSTVKDNHSSFAGAGIRNESTLNLTNSAVRNNHSSFAGGGIANLNATLAIANSTVGGNSAGNSGGGIFSTGTLTLTNSTVSDNTAESGGGILNAQGTVTLTNSTISDNGVTFNGGGIYNVGVLTLTHGTVSGNTAETSGGGIYNFGTATLMNTIVANGPFGGNCSGSIGDGGFNVDSGTTCGFSASTSLSGTDPMLDSDGLKDNGGPTMTIGLQAGSPAINAIPMDTNGCNTTITVDQRGFMRPAGSGCDIGAFEYDASAPPSDVTAPAITFTSPVNGASYLLNEVVLADYACQDEAGGSGLASCTGTVESSDAIHTATVGTHSFVVDAEDNAGNKSGATASYSVLYDFPGFSSPVSNGGVLNVAKAGQTIALKWRLLDADGAPVTTLTGAVVTVEHYECGLSETEGQLGEHAAGQSGLQNLGDGDYQFNWSTQKSYANSCKTMHLDLGEGISRTARFKFTR